MRIAIIDYGSGNLRSAQKAFERAAREAGLAADVAL
ncbi:MAG: imidazole glycerol phosphate synthase subunit HisH, partial [Rhizobiaceae bacterium]